MIRILLSNKLGELRWTQADLARATGIRPSTINEYYHELTDRINLRHFEKICSALACDFSEIVVMMPGEKPALRTRAGYKKKAPPTE